MNTKTWIGTIVAALLLVWAVGCNQQGIDDWNSSARVSGNVFADAGHTIPLPGVQVIVESDPKAPAPYKGPDRWFVTDRDGHFEGFIFLGRSDTSYVYISDLDVAYFKDAWTFRWGGGITVGPGSDFTLPAVDTVNFHTAGGN